MLHKADDEVWKQMAEDLMKAVDVPSWPVGGMYYAVKRSPEGHLATE